VSHSEADLRRFAKRGLYLQQGSLVGDGPVEEIIDQYNADVDATR